MYLRPRFLEELHAIREEMSRECDYDVELFAEMVRSNLRPTQGPARNIRGVRKYAPPATQQLDRNRKSRKKVRQGDKETGRQGDGEQRRKGEKEKRRQGDKGNR
jgi:hypothetical protein